MKQVSAKNQSLQFHKIIASPFGSPVGPVGSSGGIISHLYGEADDIPVEPPNVPGPGGSELLGLEPNRAVEGTSLDTLLNSLM